MEILSLKKTGVSKDVITLMVEKRSDVTGVLTVPGALSLKAGGVSDRVLRALLSSPAQAASLRSFLPVPGIVRLREARAWDLLKAMGLIVDRRP